MQANYQVLLVVTLHKSPTDVVCSWIGRWAYKRSLLSKSGDLYKRDHHPRLPRARKIVDWQFRKVGEAGFSANILSLSVSKRAHCLDHFFF